ncbi:MAG: hypothetical protein PHH44_02400 [bacterium]|nr:hypothetical protein [bacterium]
MDFLQRIGSRLLGIRYWYDNEQQFRWFIKRWFRETKNPVPDGKDAAGIIVSSWFLGPAPWFSVTLGLLLAQRARKVVFIVDDLPFGSSFFSNMIQRRSIRRIADLLGRCYQIAYVSSFLKKEAIVNEAGQQLVARLAKLNAINELRGEAILAEDGSYQDTISKQLLKIYGAAQQLFEEMSFDYLVIPGGINNSSGVYLNLAQAHKIRTATYDSGYGCLLVSTQGVAAQIQDIPLVFNKFRSDSEFARIAVSEAEAELLQRKSGTDKFKSQLCPATGDKKVSKSRSVLLPLNIVWDGAALGLQNFYDSSNSWLLETIRWLLENSDHQVIIRQHPHERREELKSADNICSILAKEFPGEPRLAFISAEETVSSYDLLEQVEFVVVNTSTIGVEAAILGKPVITTANVYYSTLGFVCQARTKKEYFDLLRAAIKGDLTVSAEQRDDARKCYFLTQVCNWVFTTFTPASHYREWVSSSPEQLLKQEDVQLLIKAIDENSPIPDLIYEKKRKRNQA